MSCSVGLQKGEVHIVANSFLARSGVLAASNWISLAESTAAPAFASLQLVQSWLGRYLEKAGMKEGEGATGILANERNAHRNIECKCYYATTRMAFFSNNFLPIFFWFTNKVKAKACSYKQ